MQCKMIMEERLTAREGEEHYAQNVNFLQMETSAYSQVGKILSEFTPTTEKGPAAHFNTVLMLVQKMVERAPIQADQGMVATIVRILDDLLENLDRSWAIERTAEGQRQ